MIKNWSILMFVLVLLVACSDSNNIQNEKIQPFCLPSQSACQIELSGAVINLLFDRSKIIPEHEFNIVLVSDNPIVVTSAFLEGESMYMGKIPIMFSKTQNDESWTGKGFVGSCNLEEMRWRLVIIFEVDGLQKRRSVLFNSYRL